MRYYLGFSKKAKLTEEEIGAVQSIVMAVSAGRIKAQVREVKSKFLTAADSKVEDCSDDDVCK